MDNMAGQKTSLSIVTNLSVVLLVVQRRSVGAELVLMKLLIRTKLLVVVSVRVYSHLTYSSSSSTDLPAAYPQTVFPPQVRYSNAMRVY